MTDVLVNIGTGSQWIVVPDHHTVTARGLWLPEEDHLLSVLFPHYTGGFVARALGRSDSAVRGRAAYLGIKGKFYRDGHPRPMADTLGRVA